MATKSSGFSKRALVGAILVVAIVVFAAWIDGGEQSLRTISTEIEVPAFAGTGNGL